MQYKDHFDFLSKGRPEWFLGLYVRISKEEKKKKQVTKSIEHQLEHLSYVLSGADEEFNRAVPLDNFVIYDIYIDDGYSGTDFDRPDYQRLQKDIENKIVNCFIVVDLTRYARNVKESIQGLEDFVFKTKVRFIKATDHFIDTYTNPKAISSDEVMKEITTAEDHARTTSKKIRRMQAMKMRTGQPVGGFPPYGYLKNESEFEHHYLIDPYASKIIKQIFNWAEDGYSDRQIAKMLNEQKILNPTAYKREVLHYNYQNPLTNKNSGLWWPNNISAILNDRTYTGAMVQGKTERFDHLRHKAIRVAKEKYYIVPNCHEPIISIEQFEKIQVTIQNPLTGYECSLCKTENFKFLFCRNILVIGG